ncbi:MAG: hypothetical protein ABIH00_05725 [Armatimonadota bacterium]
MEIKDEKITKNMAVIIGVAVVLVGLILYFTLDILNIKWPSRAKDAHNAQVEIYQPIKIEKTPEVEPHMVKDVVCSNLVDANKTEYYSKFLDYTFYFDTKECLDKFDADPLKYLPGKIKVKIKLKEEPKETTVTRPRVIQSQPRPKIQVENVPIDVGDYPPGTVEVSPDDQ